MRLVESRETYRKRLLAARPCRSLVKPSRFGPTPTSLLLFSLREGAVEDAEAEQAHAQPGTPLMSVNSQKSDR